MRALPSTCVSIVLFGLATGCGPGQDVEAEGALATSAEATCTETWTATGSLAAVRNAGVATRLADGRVLVAGGVSWYQSGIGRNTLWLSKPIPEAEMYQPAGGTWVGAGTMNTGRQDHRSVLLQDGRVLVAGGLAGTPATVTTASAEVYNPASNTWTTIPSMSVARYQHALTLLSDGRVLAAGGYDASNLPLSSAAVYSPVSNAWQVVQSMGTARSRAMATLLPNGRVLVAGGWSTSGIQPSAELFDPASGTWTPALPMSVPRYRAGLAALPNGKVLVIGGNSTTGAVASAEIYDPASGAWSPTGSMASPRTAFQTIPLAGGRVVVTGGQGNSTLTESYNPSTGLWTQLGNTSVSRFQSASAALLDGRALVTGGVAPGWGVTYYASAETYRPCSP